MKHFPAPPRKGPHIIHVTIDGRPMTFQGRCAWTLERLFKSGARGCDPVKHAAPRWSDYVLKLRRRGVRIETILEHHDGPYPGRHARYVLRSRVRGPRQGA